jgi:rRNA maturation endonuclease Nob1
LVQEAVVDLDEETSVDEVDEALVVCGSCEHLVPRTMVCLYCGAPILFRKPRKKGE